MDLIFYNVNEEGEAYGKHDSLAAAMPALTEFPNDTIVVAIANGPAATDYDSDLSAREG